jgi:phage nucleotide-binding protein
VGVPKINKIEETPKFLKMIIYGESGVGKTVFASTAPNCLFIDAEAGTMSIRDAGVDVASVTKFHELLDIFEYLKHEKHNYKSVVIDSLTEMMRKSMDEVMVVSAAKNPSQDIEIPAQRDWGKNIEQTRKMIRAFRDLPMNVIFTCLTRETTDETTGVVTIRPALSGKLSIEAPGYIDVLGYLYTQSEKEDKIVRRLLVQPRGKYVAKDRTGKLGIVIDNPTYGKIEKLMEAK